MYRAEQCIEQSIFMQPNFGCSKTSVTTEVIFGKRFTCSFELLVASAMFNIISEGRIRYIFDILSSTLMFGT